MDYATIHAWTLERVEAALAPPVKSSGLPVYRKEVTDALQLVARGDEPDAFGELLEIWIAEGGGDLSGVLHCYTGSLDFARRALDAGFFISFSGILTFKNDRGLRDVAKALPLERTMVETDAPLLAPQGFRGKRNEPARVRQVGEVLAAIHNRPI